MHKLLVLAGEHDGLGGTLVSRSMLALGFKQKGASEQLQILVQAGSFMERYLREAGHGTGPGRPADRAADTVDALPRREPRRVDA